MINCSRPCSVLLLAVFSLLVYNRSHANPPLDTLRVPSRAIVVFALSQTERDSMNPKERDEIEELISDFLNFTDDTRPFLDSLNISILQTMAKSFVVLQSGRTQISFNRKSMGSPVGYVFLLQGKRPLLLKGIQEPEELVLKITEYFGQSSPNPNGLRKR